jgi:hypothetical protein
VGEASSGGMAVGRVAVVWAGESDWLVFLDGERVDLDVGDGEVGTTGDDGVQTICLLDGKGREPAFYGSSEATKEGYQRQRLFDEWQRYRGHAHDLDSKGRNDQEDGKGDEHRAFADNHHGEEDDLKHKDLVSQVDSCS